MKSQFKISGKLTVAALLVGFLALPTSATPQTPDTSNASLADTITWLTTFLPTATGATLSGPNGRVQNTSSITSSNGCNLTISESGFTYAFSLSDIDPSQVSSSPSYDAFLIWLGTRGSANLIKGTFTGQTTFIPSFSVGLFADQASAQRAVNAFQHAAQLCANAQPF